ncbi:MAG: transglutaminase-like domain-containing protein, partial [Alistipes sp.]|nr:transglutaminase-like domain-containing protein [Alistipes sp.]
IENSVATITVFLIFVGAFELLLYHMWIGERIRLFDILLISFGPYIVPLFVNIYPDDLYVACLMTAYIALIILCLGTHVRNKQNVYTKRNPWSKKVKGFSYGANGLTYLASILSAFIITLCILLFVSLAMPYSTYVRNQKTSVLKEEVTDSVKYFVTFGLSGYFNRYRATGGLNDGRLGGIHSVRPDYETDLTVTLVPTSYRPVYLRGFVGIEYTDRQWYNSTGLLEAGLADIEQYNYFENDAILRNEYASLSAQNIFRSPSRIDVFNAGANPNYDYYPYYTDPELVPPYELEENGTPASGSVSTRYFLWNTEKSYYFYPELTTLKNVPEPLSYDVLLPYLQVPSETKQAIVAFLEENDLCTEYIVPDFYYNQLSGAELLTVINRLSDTLSNDFVYSLNPGITPNRYDFVGYFLNENKKGFCAHFATSATLILRSLGVPARYVEGYVLSFDDMSNVRAAENAELSDYIDTSVYTSDLAVIQADIGDDKAHAWVEYYDPAFGWRVFEATTASFESSATPDFWGNLMNLLNAGNNFENNTDDITGIGISTKSLSQVLLRILIVLLLIIVAIIGAYLSYRFTKRYRSYHRNRRNINVRNFYKIIAYSITRKHEEFAYILTFKEQSEFIRTHYKLSEKFSDTSFEKLNSILERSAFSNTEISATEYQFAMTLLKLMRRNITFHF